MNKPARYKKGDSFPMWNGRCVVTGTVAETPATNPESRLGTWAYYLNLTVVDTGEPLAITITEADLIQHLNHAEVEELLEDVVPPNVRSS